MINFTVVYVGLLLLLVRYIVSSKRKERILRLPPGPKPLPIIGNILDVPDTCPWVTYREWSRKFGSDVLLLNMPLQPIVILNSFQAAYDLLEKRSRNYSDRPRIIMNELNGWDFNFSFMAYGQRWRDLRRVFHQHFYPGAIGQYHPVQTREVRAFLKRAAAFTDGIDMRSVSQTFTSIIFDVVYGVRVHNPEDRFVWLSQKAVEALIEGTLPGRFWVESFPWLRYFPSWFPGSSARKYADRYKAVIAASRDEPFAAAKKARASSNEAASPSMVGDVLQKLEDQHAGSAMYTDYESILRDSAGVAYIAAVDTQKASIHTFFVAMAMHPSIQKKAQQQLESIIGLGRLPEIDDLPSLPYIEAIFREVSRWMPVLPMSLLHRAIEDDEYKGYTIPAGAQIIPNAWAMLHNPEDYPDPESFNPDRFIRDGIIDPGVKDPFTVTFGFGRRICPGRYLAINTLLLMIASTLHLYDILPTEDAGDIVPNPTTGLVSHPDSLPCRFKPRSIEALSLLQDREN